MVGRFISEDPSGFAGGQVNLYAYVANNPISYVDPLGLESEQAEGGSGGGDGGGFWGGVQNAWDSLLDKLSEERGSTFASGGGGSDPDTLVLGKNPDYVKVSGKINGYTFNLTSKDYKSMSSEERDSMNKGIIENALGNGHNIVFSNDPSEADPGTGFSKELSWLENDFGVDTSKIKVIRP